MNIIEQLNMLGLNGRQAKVYLTLLQLGSATAIEIAKAAKYKHPTVYDVLDALKEKRLVTETLSNGKKLFCAEDPETFQQLQQERQRTLDAIYQFICLNNLFAIIIRKECLPTSHFLCIYRNLKK